MYEFGQVVYSLYESPFLWWQNKYEDIDHLVLLYGVSSLKYICQNMETHTTLIYNINFVFLLFLCGTGRIILGFIFTLDIIDHLGLL